MEMGEAMSPELKFHSIVVGVTTGLVFGAWGTLAKMVTAHPALAVLVSVLVSLGLYRALAALLLACFRNSRWVKRLILGPHYLEGTWVGFFIGHEDKVRLFIEVFEQGLSELVIRGRSFREDGGLHGSWVAESAQVNVKLAKLSYHYAADVLGNTFVNPGIASFDVDRPAAHKPGRRLAGFSSDLFSSKKLKAIEEKLSPETMVDDTDAFKAAKDVYARNNGRT